MKTSILLISYNQEQYINECVESILNQEVSFDVELIVADDHSTDATLKIITGLLAQRKLQHKILLDKQNLGLHKNYQRGFAACTGEYIAIMEGDDYWSDPKRLEKHITFLDAHPDCVMSFNRLIIYNEAKGTFKPQKWEHPDSLEFITTAMLAERNRIGNLSACVIRRSAFLQLRSDLHEMGFVDWMLGMAMGELGRLVKFEEPMSVYRVHGHGLWSGTSPEDNFKIMINHTIDEYDKFLGYRYHKEFSIYKKRLKVSLRKAAFKRIINRIVPPSMINIIKILVPLSMRKRIIHLIR